MRIESYTVLHYGLDYLPYAIKSVIDQVDRFHVVYTPHPSHGSRTDVPPPETRAQLHAAAMAVGPKVVWHDVDAFWQEGPHRDYALSLCQGDLALVVDADEVWDGAMLERVLRFAYDGAHRDTLVACKTLWRSFNWLCEDPMQPVRVIKKAGTGTAAFAPDGGWFWHFGYAVRDEICRYKWRCHGHLAEFRQGWFEEKWEPWPPVDDVHPTCADHMWDPKLFDKERLPEVLRGHPFWDLEMIP